MGQNNQFTPSEQKVIEQLLQGKSNKQIAMTLSVTESTIEFHLNNIYTKLNVSSRTEAILQLGKSTVPTDSESPRESIVVGSKKTLYKEEATTSNRKRFIWISILLLFSVFIIGILIFNNQKGVHWTYEREAEFPDEFTTGQDIDRSNASGTKVHGHFGSINDAPWTAQPGFVKYYSIEIPKSSELYLQITYSKYSRTSVPILIFIDNEAQPRKSIYPSNQDNWNTFARTAWIPLGKIKKGIHAIRFETNGQDFGVADLDKFILTTQSP